MNKETGTIIVGSGQAGLSVGRFLKDHGRDFLILEQSSEIGTSWKNRYDSLMLDSYAKYGSLDDFPFPGDPMRQPKRDEVVEYLKAYKDHFKIEVEFNTEVLTIEKREDKFFVSTGEGVYVSKSVVLATGPFHKPNIPAYASNIPKEIRQIHSNDYRNPGLLPPGNILVVGKGNSGTEIAQELLNSGRKVFFSYKGKLKSLRNSHFSQWVGYTLGLAHVPKNSLLGKFVIWYTKSKPVGKDIKFLLGNPNITVVGECDAKEDGKIVCEKGEVENISTIIWATGFREDFAIISVPGFDPHSQKKGITNIPGLYILNTRWQFSKSSSHLAGVSRDARHIAKHISRSF